MRLPSTPIRVDGDGARLVQIFANVLNNAVKFTPRGGQIWFTADQQSTEAVVRIRDTGIGIAPDVLPRVFDMFQQAEPILERSVGGLGIGLTLARRLVEMHGGRIAISSPGPSQGTEVEIRLPITPAQAAKTVAAEPQTVAAKRNLRVLIVEDNLDAAEMLELAGFANGPRHESRPRRRDRNHHRDPVRTRRGSLGYWPAGDEWLCGRASLARTAAIHQCPYRRRHRVGAGSGSSESTRSWIRQSLHQAALSGGVARSARHNRAPHAVGARHGEYATNPSD